MHERSWPSFIIRFILRLAFFSTEPTRILTKAPNALGLQAGQIEREALEKYKSARKNIHLYRAAARLWARGISMNEALEIVGQAFDEVIQEV